MEGKGEVSRAPIGDEERRGLALGTAQTFFSFFLSPPGVLPFTKHANEVASDPGAQGYSKGVHASGQSVNIPSKANATYSYDHVCDEQQSQAGGGSQSSSFVFCCCRGRPRERRSFSKRSKLYLSCFISLLSLKRPR